MSVLIVGASVPVASAVVARLRDAGDEVRIIEDDDERASGWRALGAFVARGAPADADLVERAAQNVRTVVVLDGALEPDPIVAGTTAAGVDRIVWCARGGGTGTIAFDDADIDYVVLGIPARPRWGRGPRVSDERVAEAVDAADDLAGRPRLVLDLTAEDAWVALGLDPAGDSQKS